MSQKKPARLTSATLQFEHYQHKVADILRDYRHGVISELEAHNRHAAVLALLNESCSSGFLVQLSHLGVVGRTFVRSARKG